MKRDISKLRQYDEKAADILSSFLDKKFYSTMEDVKRIYNKKEQVEGIDIKFKLNGHLYLCDEKAAIRYINKRLSTFSMELSFINRNNEVQDGWLLDKNKINDSFLFCWIDKADKDIIESIDELKDVVVALVSRNKIINYLNEKGWTKEKLVKKGERLRLNKNEESGNIFKNGLKFSVSNQLVEKPVNVLISRDKLIEISDLSMHLN